MPPDKSINGALQTVVEQLEKLTAIPHQILIVRKNVKCSTEFLAEKIGRTAASVTNVQRTFMVTFVTKELECPIALHRD